MRGCVSANKHKPKMTAPTCPASSPFPPDCKEPHVKHQRGSQNHRQEDGPIGRQSSDPLFIKNTGKVCSALGMFRSKSEPMRKCPKDKSCLALCVSSLLSKCRGGGGAVGFWVGTMTTTYPHTANINSLGGAYINMI